jgi:tetratricopeptide (TPR) repeat protein
MKPLRQIIASPWFAFFDLACVSTAILLWIVYPPLVWRPLLLALLPWLVRLAAGKFPMRRTGFDLIMVLFLLTAISGLWASYNSSGAAGKFWLLVGAVLLFYSLAGMPYSHRWLLAALVPMAGLASTMFFLIEHFQIRTSSLAFEVLPDLSGGPLILVFPFLIAIIVYAARERRHAIALVTIFAAGLLLTGIILSGSRSAWFAAGVCFALLLMWAISCRVAKILKIRPFPVISLAFLLVGGLIIAVMNRLGSILALLPEGMVGSFNLLQRGHLAQAAWKLAEDFPFSGGGLASFPGLYSQYYESTPFYLTSFSRSLYLDIALEQGFMGLLAFVLIYLGTFWVLLTAKPSTPEGRILKISTTAGLIFVLFHGMVDNLIYTRWGAPLLFLIPGLALAFNPIILKPEPTSAAARGAKVVRRRILTIGLPLALLAVAVIYRSPVEWAASWYAGLGAVSMAKVELADFPKDRWDEGENLPALVEAEVLFERALAYDPTNRTANHRLGLINMLEHDFPEAVKYLERAHAVDPDHKGIQKTLGYSLAWNGQYERAGAVLSGIPEARQELSVYTWWWAIQERNDLSSGAASTLEFITLNYPP